jgi:hypothetical protein
VRETQFEEILKLEGRNLFWSTVICSDYMIVFEIRFREEHLAGLPRGHYHDDAAPMSDQIDGGLLLVSEVLVWTDYVQLLDQRR